MNMTLKLNAGDVTRSTARLKAAMPIAIGSAVTRGGQPAKTQLARDVAAATGMKVGSVKRRLRLKDATANDSVAPIDALDDQPAVDGTGRVRVESFARSRRWHHVERRTVPSRPLREEPPRPDPGLRAPRLRTQRAGQTAPSLGGYADGHLQFQPTRSELLLLGEYWTKVYLDDTIISFLYAQGSTWRAQCRIREIKMCVGADAVDEAMHRAEQEFAKSADPELWHVFTNGAPEERSAFQHKARVKAGLLQPEETDPASRIKRAILDPFLDPFLE